MNSEEKHIRNLKIVALAKEGRLFEDIAEIFNLTGREVRVILRNCCDNYHELIKEIKKAEKEKFIKTCLLKVEEFARQSGRTPKLIELREFLQTNDMFVLQSCQKHVLQLGFKFLNKHTKEELLNYLRKMSAELGRTPTKKDIAAAKKISYSIYFRFFGSLRKAQEAAGLVPNKSGVSVTTPRKRNPKYSDEQLINHLRELASQLGRIPMAKEVNASGKVTGETYRNRFGSFSKALKAAGLDPNKVSVSVTPLQQRNPKYSDEQLINNLRKLASQLGRIPMAKEVNAPGKGTRQTYYNRFGSFSKALEAAGLNSEK